MTLPTTGTVVSYPLGDLTSESRVIHVEPVADGRLAVLLDRTACHPVDAGWPDQRADTAVLRTGGDTLQILDATVAATDGERLYLGSDIPVRKGTDGWTWVVAHLVSDSAVLTEGDSVTVEVDAEVRRALSVGHSACHLASLALDAALADAWTKEPSSFDREANESSLIVENGSVDTFRVGKSLRKKGFDVSALDDPEVLAARVNALLAVSSGPITIERDGDLLTDRRYWVHGDARIACGGTHVSAVEDLGTITVELATEQLEGAVGLTMRTRAG